jgi:hypothetical protein
VPRQIDHARLPKETGNKAPKRRNRMTKHSLKASYRLGRMTGAIESVVKGYVRPNEIVTYLSKVLLEDGRLSAMSPEDVEAEMDRRTAEILGRK